MAIFQIKVNVPLISQLHSVNAIWDHRVLPACHPTQVNSPRPTQPDRLLLDLPTLEGWKAELT